EAGDVSGSRVADALARQHQLDVGNVEQVRQLAYQVVLVGIESTVGVGHTPQMLDELYATGYGEGAVDHRYRPEIGSRPRRLAARVCHQLVRLRFAHAQQFD